MTKNTNIKIMQSQDIIIFPTDTVYGMGVKIYDYQGLKKIYQIKKRPLNKAIIVLCNSFQQAEFLVEFTLVSYKLASYFWPGPLTLVLPTRADYFHKTGESTLGIRIPNHPLALSILKNNGPLKTTSVNISKEPPLNDYNKIVKKYQNKVAWIYPNNYPVLKISSTIIDVTTSQIIILRQGAINELKIQKVLHN